VYLSTFSFNGQQSYGFLSSSKNHLVDVVKAEKQMYSELILPSSLKEIIGNETYINRLNEMKSNLTEAAAPFCIPVNEVVLDAPIPHPKRDIICLGLNYSEHALEYTTAMENKEVNAPQYPIVFSKATTAVIGPERPVKSHRHVTNSIDYEAELAIIIGKEGTNIAKEDAFDYIFGYTIINDVTARDLQRNHSQWFLGKSLDTFGPMGPYIVTADEIPAPVKLNIQCRINGEVRQNSNTEFLIFDIPTIIETLSKGITLQPGDIIATGTPKGVGLGFDPPRFLNSGDVMEVEIEKIGMLRNWIA
jgi:2-keto-4-pentenoate hydratase/2-oxohepta-3-ene-1,7-dioic acid hydratase in catechol pathway